MLKEIHNAIITTLKAQLKIDGITHVFKSVASYEGQFEGDVDEFVNLFPCAYVDLDGVDVESEDVQHMVTISSGKFSVFIGTENLASFETRKDSAYDCIETVTAALTGSDLSLAIAPLALTSIKKIVNLPGIIIYGITFETLWR